MLTCSMTKNANRTAMCFMVLQAALFYACSGNNEQQRREPEVSGSLSTNESAALQTEVRAPSEAEAQALLALQERIKQQPRDIALRRELGRKAIVVSHAIVWSIGQAKNPPAAASPNIAQSQAELAARTDASRWAAYLVSWHKNDYATDFGAIQAQVPGGEVVSKAFTDSTCVVVMKTRLQ